MILTGLIAIELSCTKQTKYNLPVLTTVNVTGIAQRSAISGGNITDNGGASIDSRGVCWSTSANPVITGPHSTDGTGNGSFTSTLTGLTAGVLYYVRAYATNNSGTAYGNEVSFTTSAGSMAILTTATVNSVTATSSVSGGNITNDNGSDVTARGVCWSSSSGPSVTDPHTTNGIGTGIFTSSISGLNASTGYYVRAYATNSYGTAYGNEEFFTTSPPSLAILTTATVGSITTTTAMSGGNITNDNGSDITARGVCWSTSTSPTIADAHTTNGAGTGVFTSNLTNLVMSTTYYVRAYATNGIGTSYGNQVNFTTKAGPGLNEVWIQDMAFSPATITISAGTTITWTNKDGIPHTVTSTTGVFNSGSIAANGTYSHTFNIAGAYPYYCTIHPSMTAIVIVN